MALPNMIEQGWDTRKDFRLQGSNTGLSRILFFASLREARMSFKLEA